MSKVRYLSLFSGIEAASAAWEPLGWECVAVSEIESFPCEALKYHYLDVPNLGDVTKITEEQIKALGKIDIIVFGSPCQDLSVAGKRKGLIDDSGDATRSGLFYTAINIVKWAKTNNGLRFALWENVPGSFSSNKGADFASVVGCLAGLEDVPVPTKGWGNEGCILGESLVEWSTLDAQWFGVAQRRRRVFALADFGAWECRSPILLESESLRGDFAPSRETRQETSRGSGEGSESCFGIDEECNVGNNLFGPLLRGGQGGTRQAVAFAQNTRDEVRYINGDGAIAAKPGMKQTTYVMTNEPIAVHTTGAGFWQEGFGTLRAREQDSHENLAVVSTHRMVAFGEYSDDGTASAMKARDYKDATDLVAYGIPGNWIGRKPENGGNAVEPMHDVSPCQTSADRHGVCYDMQVRRLTPTECERLQGFPDGYTNIPWRGKPNAPDGLRYKALGNSFAVSVIGWIGDRINQKVFRGE